jgi:hypothetical protein
MIPRRSERIPNALEYAFSIMPYRACFSMHKLSRMDYFAAENVNDSLVSKANAQRRHAATYLLQYVFADAEVSRFFGGAWTWRQDNSARFQRLNFPQSYFVIPVDNCFCA